MNRLTAKTPVMVQQVDLKSLVASYCVVGFSSLLSVQLFSNLPNPVVLQARHAAWAPSATADHAPAKHDDHHHHHVHVKPSLNDGIPPEHLVAPYGDPNKMLGEANLNDITPYEALEGFHRVRGKVSVYLSESVRVVGGFTTWSFQIIIFDQHVFHPSVDPRTNRLHLPESASNDHERWALHKIVNSLSEIFRMRHFDKLPHVNEEAVKSYRLADKQTFRDRVDRCVRFSKFDELLHRPLLNEIVGTNDETESKTDETPTQHSGDSSPDEERERNSWVNSAEFTMLRAD
ncbi:unnamed protein product [Sphagnum balticum]